MRYTDSKEYQDFLKKMSKKDKEDRNWKATVVLVKDTQLLYFLKTKHPEVLLEFYEGRVRDGDTPNTKV